jgi:hypothetical protein
MANTYTQCYFPKTKLSKKNIEKCLKKTRTDSNNKAEVRLSFIPRLSIN